MTVMMVILIDGGLACSSLAVVVVLLPGRASAVSILLALRLMFLFVQARLIPLPLMLKDAMVVEMPSKLGHGL